MLLLDITSTAQLAAVPSSRPTCFSARLPRSQVDDGRAEGAGLSYPATAVSDHAAGVADQLDELLKGNVLHCTEVWMPLDALFSHHAHHLLTSCLQKRKQLMLLHTHAHT